IRHFGLVRQLAQHRAEGLFHFGELRLVGVEIGRLARLALELGQQLLLLRTGRIEQGLLRLPGHEVDQSGGRDHENDCYGAETERLRSAPRVVRVEVADLLDQIAHFAPLRTGLRGWSSSALGGICGFSCTALSVKSEPASPRPLVCRMSSAGSASQSDESMLRIYEATRVLDCAVPLS